VGVWSYNADRHGNQGGAIVLYNAAAGGDFHRMNAKQHRPRVNGIRAWWRIKTGTCMYYVYVSSRSRVYCASVTRHNTL